MIIYKKATWLPPTHGHRGGHNSFYICRRHNVCLDSSNGAEMLTSLLPASFQLAKSESNNFFTDISNEEWKLTKSIAHAIQPNSCCSPEERKARGRDPHGNVGKKEWFQDNYEPEFLCRHGHEVRIGRKGDGGKWVCDPHRIQRRKSSNSCLVYSIGSQGDASFESALLENVSTECEIHIFDFGDFVQTTAEQTGHSKTVFYHQWGISGGCFDTFRKWLDAPIKIQQILVEIHDIGEKAHDMFKTCMIQDMPFSTRKPTYSILWTMLSIALYCSHQSSGTSLCSKL